jgi:hypothetical protein
MSVDGNTNSAVGRAMRKYQRTVRRAFEEHGTIEPGREIPLPAFARAESQLAVRAMVHGRFVGVLAIESPAPAAFDEGDEALLGVVAGLIASAIEITFAYERAAEPVAAVERGSAGPPPALGPATQVRYFPVDGSIFLGAEYLIKGVAGRVLWSLLDHYTREGRVEFTNREVRLDPSLELPELRDNLESRLILLKRRSGARRPDPAAVSGTLRLEDVGGKACDRWGPSPEPCIRGPNDAGWSGSIDITGTSRAHDRRSPSEPQSCLSPLNKGPLAAPELGSASSSGVPEAHRAR